MDSTFDLPKEVVKKLRCFVCNKYLSCGPMKQENGNLICGRCNSSDLNTGLQMAFQKIMENFKFPCQYDEQGCEEHLLFNTSIEHETTCRYRTLHCPVNSCSSLLYFSEFYGHFTEFHKNLVVTDGQFTLKLDDNSDCNLLMVQNNTTIVIKYFYDFHTKRLRLEVASEPDLKQLIHLMILCLIKISLR